MARDYFEEAYKIAYRQTKMKPRREHIEAVVNRLNKVLQQSQRIYGHIQAAAEYKKSVDKARTLQKLKDMPKTINGTPIKKN